MMMHRLVATIAAQFNIALHLSRRQDTNGRQGIFEMGFAERTLRGGGKC